MYLDHFLEQDTFDHCEQSLGAILKSGITNDILCDIGCPIMHKGVRYNCRVYCLDGKIVLIRPKMMLANDGNYREHRFFAAWRGERKVEEHTLSSLLSSAMNAASKGDNPNCISVPFGISMFSLSVKCTVSLLLI